MIKALLVTVGVVAALSAFGAAINAENSKKDSDFVTAFALQIVSGLCFYAAGLN